MLDRDLGELYGVPTFRLNEQVKRNMKRFPMDFMYQLTKEEFKNLKREIFWGFIMDRWTPKTFVIENNEIIEFCPDEVKAVKNTRVQKKNKDSSSRVLKTVKMKMRTFDE